jgi:hypothetical protein
MYHAAVHTSPTPISSLNNLALTKTPRRIAGWRAGKTMRGVKPASGLI